MIEASADNFVALYAPVFGNSAVDAFADRIEGRTAADGRGGQSDRSLRRGDAAGEHA